MGKCVYKYIQLFGDLYPTLLGIMGGTETFPPDNLVIKCKEIPDNYDDLPTLNRFLWRFNDFSYCKYLENIAARQINLLTCSKINAKARYLVQL